MIMKKSFKIQPEQWQGRIVEQRTKNRSQYVGAPSVSKSVMAIYKELLKKSVAGKKKFNACVLGATPELRNIVLGMGGYLTSLDINLEMFDKLKPYMKCKDSEKEVIVKADWLNNPLASEYYDVVLGDGISNNIPLKKQNKLFKEINRLIKKDGYVILRDLVINPERPIRCVEDIDKDFVDKKIHWFDVFADIYFYSDISSHCYDKKTYKSDLGKLYKDIEKCHKQGRLSNKTFKALWWFRSDIQHTFMPRSMLEKFLKKHFKLLSVRQAQDFHFTQDTLIFHFGKPKKK